MTHDNFANGNGRADDRFVGQIGRVSTAMDNAPPIASSLTPPKLIEPALRERNRLEESPYPGEGWLDVMGGPMADHPLLRGLLMELPPKGTLLAAEWMDRWFEAARSIMELLYSQESADLR